MSIDYEMRFDFGRLNTVLEAIAPVALARGGEVVRTKAVERTPNATDNLAGSAGVTVTGAGLDSVADLKYAGPYAAFQNRGMRADGTHVIRNRPAGGQTGFLTESMVDQRGPAIEEIASVIRAHL